MKYYYVDLLYLLRTTEVEGFNDALSACSWNDLGDCCRCGCCRWDRLRVWIFHLPIVQSKQTFDLSSAAETNDDQSHTIRYRSVYLG